jgi:hypothetical protein
MEQHILPKRRKYIPDHKIHAAEESKLQRHSDESLKSNTKQRITKILILIIKGLVTGQMKLLDKPLEDLRAPTLYTDLLS